MAVQMSVYKNTGSIIHDNNTADSAGAGHAGIKGQTGELELHRAHASLGLAATRTEGAQSGPTASHVPGSVRRGRQ